MPAKLTYNDNQYLLDTDKTLLENLESHAVPIEFQCRDGHCGACRAVLISGNVSYSSFPMAYLKDNEILLCCSKTTKDIVIKNL